MEIRRKIEFLAAEILYVVCNGILECFQKLLFQRRLPTNPKTVLVYRSGHLGDTVCAIPAIQAVQQRFPQARLLLMTNITNGEFSLPKDVLERNAKFYRVLTYDPSRVNDRDYLTEILGELRMEKIDLLVYLGQSIARPDRLIRDMLFFKAAKCKAVCGFRFSTHRFFAVAQREVRQFDPEPLRLVKLLEPLKIPAEVSFGLPEISYSIAEIAQTAGRVIVAIHPSAKVPVKRWPLDRFVEVAKYLQSRHRAFLVLVGGDDASTEAKVLTDALHGKDVLDLTGRIRYWETAGALKGCRFLLSNDSGPVHLAATVNTPVVGIYSARDFPKAWYPWGERHQILRKDVACQICYLEECPTMRCIKEITVDEVIRACDAMLAKRT